MSEENQAVENEGLLDEGIKEVQAAEAEAKEEHPEVIEDVFAKDPEEVNTAIASEDEDTEFVRPEYFPEKFWNDEDGPDVEGLVKSYREMEKNFSQGKHKVPEEYDISFAEQSGIPQDDPLMARFSSWAKEHGVSQSAFEALAKDYIEMETSSLEQFKVDVQAEKDKLGPDADQIIKSTANWANGLLNKGVFNEEELEAFKTAAGTAAGVRALQKLRRFYGEAQIPVAEPSMEGVPTKDELYAMVGTKEYKEDPAYRNKVQKWFKVRFPDDPNTDYII
jgi:hypothetical protein|tara:strand:+ start:2746 stop:3579 length:834 start_codon:yes stop_codon:yes gene_type:complete